MSTLSFILTAVLASITTLIAPTLVMRIRRYFTRIKQNKTQVHKRVKQLEEQVEIINNILNNRDKNQRDKIRKEVNLYLEELKND